jgi:hypothetical protein
MEPTEITNFGSGGESSLSLLGIAILFGLLAAMFFVSRRNLIVPFLFVSVLVPVQQQLVILGAHLPALRLAILTAWAVCLLTRKGHSEFLSGGWQRADSVFLAWSLVSGVAFVALWRTPGSMVFASGQVYNSLGCYFLVRHLIRDRLSVLRMLRTLAYIAVLLAAAMVLEQFTSRNLFSIFGAPLLDEIRRGRVRSQGPFLHSLIAGTVGGILLPVFVGLWYWKRTRKLAVIGAAAALAMAITAMGSTPLSAAVAGVFALCLWGLRDHMRLVRWAVVALVVSLHMVMKAPVWALVARVGAVGGSSAWHRFELIDQTIQHFSEWWMVGTTHNAEWGWDMWDKADWYVTSALNGGLASLALFIAVIGVALYSAGKGRRRYAGNKEMQHFMWALGSAVFAGAVAFIGINFWDQSQVIWYGLLALTVSCSTGILAKRNQRSRLLRQRADQIAIPTDSLEDTKTEYALR